MLDAGSGAATRLVQAGRALADLDGMFISHTHQDHIADLMPLLQGLAATEGDPRRHPLPIYGPATVKEYGDRALAMNLIAMLGFPVGFTVLADGDEFALGTATARVRRMRHPRGALGFRVERDGAVFVYSADTGPCVAVEELATGADLLLLEAAFPVGEESEIHLTTAQAGEIARRAGVGSLLLTHLYPAALALPAQELERQVRGSGYNGDLRVARDGDVIGIDHRR
jgi:ribonuclease BN (tRNA processing enzyme)